MAKRRVEYMKVARPFTPAFRPRSQFQGDSDRGEDEFSVMRSPPMTDSPCPRKMMLPKGVYYHIELRVDNRDPGQP